MEDILKSLQLLKLSEPGEQLINDKKYEEGILFFTKLIEKFPNESLLYDKRASCYIYLENAEKAIEDSTIAIKLDKENLKSYFRNLRCYIFLGNIKKARYYAENGLKYSKKSNISKANNKLFQVELDNIKQIEEILESVKRSFIEKRYINALKYLEEAFIIADPTLEKRKKSKGISILGNISTNGVCKEWQLLRGKLLLKCKEFLKAKKVSSTMENKYSSFLHGKFFTIYLKYIYDEISLTDAKEKLKDIIKELNNTDDNEVDFYDNDDIMNEILDFINQADEVENLRNKYNEDYKQGNYQSADRGYNQCLKIYNKYELQSISYIKLLSNLSNTKSKLNNYKLSSEYCTKAIELLEKMIIGNNNKKEEKKIQQIDKSTFKSLFTKLYMRRAFSLRNEKLYNKAINDYEFLLKILPDDEEIKKAINDSKKERDNKNKSEEFYNNNNNDKYFNQSENNYSNYQFSEIDDEENYYTLLGLKFVDNPNSDAIKKAFHKMALKYHPDKCQGKTDKQIQDAEKKFKKINEAYSVLSNKDLKESYDNKLKYEDFFNLFFNLKPKPKPKPKSKSNMNTNKPKKAPVSTDELLDQFINEENNKKFFFGLF